LEGDVNGPEGVPVDAAFGDRDHARASEIARHRRALLANPSDPAALAALVEHARAQRDWVRLALLQGRRFANGASSAERARIALELARVEDAELWNPAAAREWICRGVEAAPEAVELYQRIAALARAGGAAALIDSLERVIAARSDSAPVEALLTAAALHVEHGNAARGLAHLERATAQAPDRVDVIDALVDALAALRRHADLADALERSVALHAGMADACVARLVRLGDLYEAQLFDPEAALGAYERAHALDPGAPGAAEATARLRAKIEGRPDPAAAEPAAASALEAYEREALVTNDRDRLGALVGEIEKLHVRLGTPDQAIRWVQRWITAAPEEPAALRALARLYDRPGHEARLVAALGALDRLLAPAEQIANRKRVAALHQSLAQRDEAERAFARVLELDPGDPDALAGRVELLRAPGRESDLAGALEQLAERQSGEPLRAALLELADLHERRGDLARATAVLLRAESEPSGADLCERIDDLLARARRHEDLVHRLAQRADARERGPEAAALDLRRAAILKDALHRPEDAASVYRSVLAYAPDSHEARAGLERALRSGVDATGLAGFLEDQERRSGEPERSHLALERALLLEERLDRAEDALAIFDRLAVGNAVPEVVRDAEEHCERLLERLQRWPALRDHWMRSLGRHSAEVDARLHERLAHLCADRLSDPAGEILHLESAVALDARRSDLWQLLAVHYERANRRQDCARALEAELANRPDHARELELRARLAALYGELAQPERARSHHERVFDLCPTHPAAAHFLESTYEQEHRYEDLVALLETRLASMDGVDPHATSHRTALRLQIAHVREAHLDDLEGSISALEVALEELGPDALVTEPLAAAYQRGNYHDDLIVLCRTAAAAGAHAEERANWWARLGDAHLCVDQPQEAAEAYRQALTERPGDRAVEASLRELYRALGRSEPLVALLEAELLHLAGTTEVPVRLELVERLRTASPANALVHASRVLQLAPRHRGALDAALALAESLGRGEDALALLDARIGACQSPHESGEWHQRKARLLAGALALPAAAIDSYRAALAVEPAGRSGAELRRELAALLESEGRWSEWLDCEASRLADCAVAERAALVERAARTAWQRISAAAALPWLERLRVDRAEDPEVLAEIARAHRELGNREALVRALEAQAGAASGETAARCHLERAALLREAGERGRALAALVAAGPLPEALRQRASLERELGLHAHRAETLEMLLGQHGPDLDLHRELAALYSVELRAPEAAARHWEAAQRLVPTGSPAQVEILASLANAERAIGRVGAWARHAERELAALDPAPVFDDRRRELRRELALAYDADLARPDAALAHVRALLDASDVALLGRDTQDRVEQVCLRLLRAEGSWVELERRLAGRLARIGGTASDWLELATVREETLRHTSAALDAYRVALERDPAHLDALHGLRRTAERLGRWRDVAEALERELECARDGDPTDRGALLRALADIHWHRLSSTTRASRYYAAALEANAADFAALRALERLLEAMEDWRGALDLYESEADVLGSANPKRRREIWLHVTALARDCAGDPERARQALRRAGEIERLDTPQLAEIAALHHAVGDRESFVAALASWCDARDARASASDHLRLAVALEELGRTAEAAARIERAVACDPRDAAVWDVAARLRSATGDALGSARALARAAEQMSDAALAAGRLREAAARSTARDPDEALALLRCAVERSPGDAVAQVARARLAAQLGRDDEAELAARAALEIVPDALDLAARAAVARTGAEAARRRGRNEVAASFYAEALHIEPDDADALGAYGEVLVALGDHPAARQVLERRVASADRYSGRAAHCALLGRCLELAGEPEQALVHYGDALHGDPLHPLALESSARVLEELDRIDPGIAAIERWARAARTGAERGARLLRAAQWELRRGGRADSAERHLRAAAAADPGLAPAWIALAELRIDAGRLDDAIEATDRAAAHVGDPTAFAALAYLQGRALEQKGERREAALCFGIAAECDPRCAPAALAQARLLRGFGEWREAASALASFAERHPTGRNPALADVHEQLGRLLAGPLEDLESAVLTYRRAIDLAPERIEARAALAELLSQRPGDWDEALEHHRLVLGARPSHAGSLRVVLRIARGRGDPAPIAAGVAITRALGIATGYESEADAAGATLITHEPTLADARFELLRGLAIEAAAELAEALGGGSSVSEPASGDDPVVAFRSRVLAVQAELSAAALLTRSARDVREVMQLLVSLVLDPDHVSGDGTLVNALSASLGRRRRKKLRKILGEDASTSDLAGVDFDVWCVELRALAAAEVIRRDSTPLRTALTALIAESESAPDPGNDVPLAPHIEAEPAARALLRRIVDDWLARL
jgi:tetratricopeptide (TPR) repeat protein